MSDEFIKECLKLADKLLDPCCGKQAEIKIENNLITTVTMGGPRLYVICADCGKEYVSRDTGTIISKWNGREHKFNESEKITLTASL